MGGELVRKNLPNLETLGTEGGYGVTHDGKSFSSEKQANADSACSREGACWGEVMSHQKPIGGICARDLKMGRRKEDVSGDDRVKPHPEKKEALGDKGIHGHGVQPMGREATRKKKSESEGARQDKFIRNEET